MRRIVPIGEDVNGFDEEIFDSLLKVTP